MGRDRQEPQVEKFVNDIHRDSVETHPAFAQIGASRVQGSTVLYGSDFKHNAYMTVTISRSDVTRSLSNDWHHAGKELIQVAMSESQWATFISTPNAGQGSCCTLEFFAPGGDGDVPGIVHPTDKREQFVREVDVRLQDALDQLGKLRRIIDGANLSGKAKAEMSSVLGRAVTQLTRNIGFVAEQFGEHVEKVTDAAKTEIHAYMENAISRAGLRAIAASNERPFELLTGTEQPRLGDEEKKQR